MNSSYKNDDVIFLLKDITGRVKPLPSVEREKLIQSGMHYSEMLPIEYIPTDEYMEIYFDSFKVFGQKMADALASLADKVIEKRGKNVVLVSLARAGTPIGVLLKRYIKWKYETDVLHYGVSEGLAVVSDPAGETDLAGTYDDIFIPSSALNATVCGLISRTFLRNDIIGEGDFHGAVYYKEYEKNDLSYHFIENIEKLFKKDVKPVSFRGQKGIIEVKKQADRYGIKDINLIKPGIGETTRVLLRRVPWKVLIDERYKDDRQLRHIIKLAQEKKVEIEYTSLNNYKCMGIIKKMKDI